MLPAAQGWAPAAGLAERLQPWLAPLQDRLTLHLHERLPLLDSSAIRPGDWFTLAADIQRLAEKADAVLVIHGTDTLAWTATALHWLLAGLDKPVILTGAQYPLETPDSDAPGNLMQALRWAEKLAAGVYISFAHQLWPAENCRKYHSQHRNAFANPFRPPLGWSLDDLRPGCGTGTALPSHWQGLDLRWPEQQLLDFSDYRPNIVRLPLVPGMDDGWLSQLPEQLDGLILEATGSGNPPPLPGFFAAIKTAIRHDLPVGLLSQCWSGGTHASYAAAQPLRDAGISLLGQMTPETAQARLTCLLGLRQLGRINAQQLLQLWLLNAHG